MQFNGSIPEVCLNIMKDNISKEKYNKYISICFEKDKYTTGGTIQFILKYYKKHYQTFQYNISARILKYLIEDLFGLMEYIIGMKTFEYLFRNYKIVSFHYIFGSVDDNKAISYAKDFILDNIVDVFDSNEDKIRLLSALFERNPYYQMINYIPNTIDRKKDVENLEYFYSILGNIFGVDESKSKLFRNYVQLMLDRYPPPHDTLHIDMVNECCNDEIE